MPLPRRRSRPVDRAPHDDRGQRRCRTGLAAAEQAGIPEIRGHRRQRHRRHAAVRQSPARWRRSTRPSPSTSSSCSATTCTGASRRQDFVKKFEKPYAAAARGRREVPGLARQPRSARERVVQALQHERAALLHLRAQQRPVLRARQHADGSEAAGVARSRAARRARGLEDLLLPSPAVFRCGAARFVGRPARPARADLRRSTASTSSSPATTTSTSASSRRRASTTSCPARRASCERATCGPTTRRPRTSTRTRASCSSKWRATTCSSRRSRGRARPSTRA